MEAGFKPQKHGKGVSSAKQEEHRQEGVTRVEREAKNGASSNTMLGQEATLQMNCVYSLYFSWLYT